MEIQGWMLQYAGNRVCFFHMYEEVTYTNFVVRLDVLVHWSHHVGAMAIPDL